MDDGQWMNVFRWFSYLWYTAYYFMIGFVAVTLLSGVLDARDKRTRYETVRDNTKKTFAKQKSLTAGDKAHWARLKGNIKASKCSELKNVGYFLAFCVLIYCLAVFIPKYHPFLAQFKVNLVSCCMVSGLEIFVFLVMIRPVIKDSEDD